MRKVVLLVSVLFFASCSKKRVYITPALNGVVVDAINNEVLESVNVSVALKNKDFPNLLSFLTNRKTNNNGVYSINSKTTEIKASNLQEIQRMNFKYFKILLFKKKGYVTDTVYIEKFWNFNDTIVNVGTVYLKPITE